MTLIIPRDATAEVKKGIFRESTHYLLEDLGDDLIALIRPKLNALPPGDEKNDYLALLGDIEEYLDKVVTANKSMSFMTFSAHQLALRLHSLELSEDTSNKKLIKKQKEASDDLADLLHQIDLIPVEIVGGVDSDNSIESSQSDHEKSPRKPSPLSSKPALPRQQDQVLAQLLDRLELTVLYSLPIFSLGKLWDTY